jgi:hypothetical protein
VLEGEKPEEPIEDARLGVTAGGVPMTLIVTGYRLIFLKGAVQKIQHLYVRESCPRDPPAYFVLSSKQP